jgi:acyl carrier protein
MLTQVSNADHSTMVARISSLFSDVMHVDVPSAETDLFDTGILDSQRFVELLLQIEQKFHTRINIENCELENFRCIEKIATFIAQHHNG